MSDTAALLCTLQQQQLHYRVVLNHVIAGMQEMTAVFNFISGCIVNTSF
jgi:hypothetical protein